jgi:hypothetical protein
MIPNWRRPCTIILRRRRTIAMRVVSPLVYARIVRAASKSRVVVCAWRRPAVVAPTTNSCPVPLIARAQLLPTWGTRRHRSVVVGVWARRLVLGHHCSSLAIGQCLFLCDAMRRTHGGVTDLLGLCVGRQPVWIEALVVCHSLRFEESYEEDELEDVVGI